MNYVLKIASAKISIYMLIKKTGE